MSIGFCKKCGGSVLFAQNNEGDIVELRPEAKFALVVTSDPRGLRMERAETAKVHELHMTTCSSRSKTSGCEPWEEIMSSMVLFERWGITPKEKAKALATEIRKSFEDGTRDLEQLLKTQEIEYNELWERMQKYEPDWKPTKFT